MAYGDNRTQRASDTFDTSISASWDNGPDGWGTFVWATGGIIQTSGGNTDTAMRRNAETFASDQYSISTIETYDGLNDGVGAVARMQADADDSYLFIAGVGGVDEYRLFEISASRSFTELGSLTDPGTEIPLATGDTITIECEGSTIRGGSDAGGSDVEKVSVTDNTKTGGRPGPYGLREGGAAQLEITAWSGGDIGAVDELSAQGVIVMH